MKPFIFILITSLLVNANAQNLNCAILSHKESVFLDNHYSSMRKDFSFKNKTVAFFQGPSKLQPYQKNEFFKEQHRKLNIGENPISDWLVFLSKEQKENSGGYDIIIICSYKKPVSEKTINKIINDLPCLQNCT